MKLCAGHEDQWAHVSCALFTPECYFKEAETHTGICGLSKIPAARRRLTCLLCGEKGTCAQCCVAACTASFHPHCGAMEGMQMVVTENDAGIYTVRCDRHRTDVPSTANRIFCFLDARAGDPEEAVSISSSLALKSPALDGKKLKVHQKPAKTGKNKPAKKPRQADSEENFEADDFDLSSNSSASRVDKKAGTTPVALAAHRYVFLSVWRGALKYLFLLCYLVMISEVNYFF